MKDKYSIEVRKRYHGKAFGYAWDWRIVHTNVRLGHLPLKEYKSYSSEYSVYCIKTREAAVQAAKEALEEYILLHDVKYEWETVDET